MMVTVEGEILQRKIDHALIQTGGNPFAYWQGKNGPPPQKGKKGEEEGGWSQRVPKKSGV